MLVCQVFRAFTAVMKNCPTTREWFERRVGHYRLTQLVSTITQPTINLLQEAMNMVSPSPLSLSLSLSLFLFYLCYSCDKTKRRGRVWGRG